MCAQTNATAGVITGDASLDFSLGGEGEEPGGKGGWGEGEQDVA